MKKELIHLIKSIKNVEVMKKFIANMNFDTREEFFSLMSFVDEETQDRWIEVYSEM